MWSFPPSGNVLNKPLDSSLRWNDGGGEFNLRWNDAGAALHFMKT